MVLKNIVARRLVANSKLCLCEGCLCAGVVAGVRCSSLLSKLLSSIMLVKAGSGL